MTDKSKSPLPPLLALSLLPAMSLLGESAGNYVFFTIGVMLSLLPEALLLGILNALIKKPAKAQGRITRLFFAVSAVYFLAVTVYAVSELVGINGFLSQHRIGAALISVLLLLSGAYISSLSQGAQYRLSAAVLIITLLLFAAAALMAIKNGSALNLHLSSPTPADDMLKGLASGAALMTLDVYYPVSRISVRCERLDVLKYAALKAAVLLLFTLPVIYVLGEHIHYSKMPAYDLAAFSKSVLIERFNGLYTLILTLSAAVMAALGMSTVRVCVISIAKRKEVTNETA